MKLQVLTIAFLACLGFASHAHAQNFEYTVRKGDTLSLLAKLHWKGPVYGPRGSLQKLLAANPGLDPRRLRVGQAIRIPENTTVHHVRPGDSLSLIARRYFSGRLYGPSGALEKLLALNPELTSKTHLMPGQAVKIYPGDDASATSVAAKPVSAPATTVAAKPAKTLLEEKLKIPGFEAGVAACKQLDTEPSGLNAEKMELAYGKTYECGRYYFKRGDYRAALLFLKRARTLGPTHLAPLFLSLRSHIILGQKEEAKQTAIDMVFLDPSLKELPLVARAMKSAERMPASKR